MSKISINDIADILVSKNGLEKNEAESFVTSIFDTLQDALERESIVKIKGLGTFKIIGVEARESVNVNTGERVVIERHGKVTFTPDNTMKELVNKPFSQFETVVLNEGVEFDDMKDDKDDSLLEKEQEVLIEQHNDTVIDNNNEESEDKVHQSETEPSGDDNLCDMANEKTIDTQDNSNDDVQPYGINVVNAVGPGTNDDNKVADCREEENAVIDEKIIQDNPPVDNEEKEKKEDNIETMNNNVMESSETDGDEDSIQETTPAKRALHWLLYGACSVLFIGLAFGAGYYFAMKTIDSDTDNSISVHTRTDSIQKRMSEAAIAHTDNKEQKNDTLSENDTLSTLKDRSVVVTRNDKIETATKNVVKNEKRESTDKKEFDSSVYDKMDVRVRTGAYRIIGTDFEKTVRQGETLHGISRQLLGEGMSCYIEVYNGLDKNSELKAGQKIKIPKLELKKKRKAKTKAE